LYTHAGTKSGGQALLGGLDCTVHRNFFGAQIRSFITKLKAPACMKDFGAELEDFTAVFIRLAFVADQMCYMYVVSPHAHLRHIPETKLSQNPHQ